MDTVLSIPRGAVSDQLILALGPQGTVVGVDAVLHPGRVLLFDAEGRIAADADISHLLVPGAPFFSPKGEILVPDGRYGTIQRLTPSLEPSDSFMAVEYPRGGIVLSSGAVLVNAVPSTAERARYALHLLNPGDDRVMSMDRSDMRLPTPGNSYELKRHLAPRNQTSFWSLHGTDYRIDLWNTSGRLIESLYRDAPWFERRTMRSSAHLTPPPGELKGLAADPDGLLWVLLSIADPEWMGYDFPAVESGSYPGRNRHLEDGVYDSVLEVVDPSLGAVIARAQYDDYFSGFAGPKVVVHYDGSSNNAGAYTVLRLSLIRADKAGVP